MMAPGIPEIAVKYGITSPTVMAMTLSIFLLSFAIGVSEHLLIKRFKLIYSFSHWY